VTEEERETHKSCADARICS